MHHVGEGTRGKSKRRQVAGNVEGLNTVLRIVFIIGIAPPAHFHIEFAEMLISSPVVKGIETQNCGRFQMGNIPDHKNVSSISETSRQFRLRAGPAPVAFLHSQVKSSACIGPGVISIVEVVQSAAIAGNGPYIPIVSTELKRLGRCYLNRPVPFTISTATTEPPAHGSDIQGRRRVISRVDQQGCVLKSKVSGGAPGSVCFDRNKGLVGPGLYPPRSAPGINNNLLTRACTRDTPGDHSTRSRPPCAAGGILVNATSGFC